LYESIVLDGDKRLREFLGSGFQLIVQSGKVVDRGLFGGMRGGDFIVDIEVSDELYSIFGPEVYGNCHVEMHPIVPLEKAGGLLQQWASEGR
jgi:hypothetical protein